jgi:hypothetical protein
MLNRTNRTLSANLNRLNLGTRSLAASANVINGDKTLRTRHVHRVVMRDGITGYSPAPIPIGPGAMSPIPSSPSVPVQLVPSWPVWARVDLAAESFPDADSHCQFGEFQDRELERFRQQQEGSKRSRQTVTGWQLREQSGLGKAAASETLTAPAATLAAAGG